MQSSLRRSKYPSSGVFAGISEQHGQDGTEPQFAGTPVRAARPNLDRRRVEFSGCVAAMGTAHDRLRYDGAEELDDEPGRPSSEIGGSSIQLY